MRTAVDRRLSSTRVDAETRVQHLLDAAVAALADAPDGDFTLEEVLVRAGQSLRSFYTYFPSKGDLLLAVVEEVVATVAARLEGTRDLRALVVRCSAELHASHVSDLAQGLWASRPGDVVPAFRPLNQLVEELLREGVTRGTLRADLDAATVAGLVLQAAVGRRAAEVVDLLLDGLTAR